MNYVANAGTLIVETLVGLYLYIVVLRFLMQWIRADFRNPLGQFIITVTNPLILPLRAILPPIGAIDTASLVAALGVAFLKVWALLTLASYSVPIGSLLIFAVSELVRSGIHLFIAATLVTIIASWIASGSYHPVVWVAHQIAEPLLAPARRLIPPIGGLDLSPILVFLFLNLSLTLLVAPFSPFI